MQPDKRRQAQDGYDERQIPLKCETATRRITSAWQLRDAARIQLDMKIPVMAASVLCIAALLPLPAFAQMTAQVTAQSTAPGTSGVPTAQPGPLPDRSLATLRQVTSSNLFEIESSRLALARSQSKLLKEFADQMVGDHTRAANRVRQVLAEMGASPPPAMLEPAHQQQLDALKAAENQQFDQAYIEAQYTAHVEAITVVREYAHTGDNERLKALAADALPMLQSHLDHVTRLRDGAKPR